MGRMGGEDEWKETVGKKNLTSFLSFFFLILKNNRENSKRNWIKKNETLKLISTELICNFVSKIN